MGNSQWATDNGQLILLFAGATLRTKVLLFADATLRTEVLHFAKATLRDATLRPIGLLFVMNLQPFNLSTVRSTLHRGPASLNPSTNQPFNRP